MSDPTDFELTLRIADDFCKLHNDIVFCLETEQFYQYREGIYNKIFDREMHDLILQRKSQTKQKTVGFLKMVTERIATIRRKRLEEFNTGTHINFENCLFDLATNERLAHTPEVISTIRIPYLYDPEADCPLWTKSLNEILQNDLNKLRTIQEFFGYCLTRSTIYEKCLILTGEGANGKSTILHTLRHMVGTDNCSDLSLRHFSDPQKTSILQGKLVNLCSEVPRKIEDYESEFKSIVSGESMQVSPKYISDYTFMPYCKLIMAINDLPYIDDRTSAFYRRLLVVPLLKQFKEEEQNKDLRKQLLTELSGIFNWAIIGLSKLKERNTFLIDEYMKRDIEEIREANNPIMSWAKDNIIVQSGNDLEKGEAYEAYKEWSIKNGYKPFGLSKFAAEVFKLFHNFTEKSRRSGSGDRSYIWPNLAMKPKEPPGPNLSWNNE